MSNKEITPEMIEAGVLVLKENYLDLTSAEGIDEFPRIIRAVYEAMAAAGPA